jgi:hypothetical protein
MTLDTEYNTSSTNRQVKLGKKMIIVLNIIYYYRRKIMDCRAIHLAEKNSIYFQNSEALKMGMGDLGQFLLCLWVKAFDRL